MPIPANTNSRIEQHYTVNGVRCMSKLYYNNDDDITDAEVASILTDMLDGFFMNLLELLSNQVTLNELRLVPMESPMLYDYALTANMVGQDANPTICPFTVVNLNQAAKHPVTGRAIYNHVKQSGLPRTSTQNGSLSAAAQVALNSVLSQLIGIQTFGGTPGSWRVRGAGNNPPATIVYATIALVNVRSLIYTLDKRKE